MPSACSELLGGPFPTNWVPNSDKPTDPGVTMRAIVPNCPRAIEKQFGIHFLLVSSSSLRLLKSFWPLTLGESIEQNVDSGAIM